STSICYINKKFKSKIKYADNMNSKYAVIIGEDEINTNTLTIKNMVTGEQTQVRFDEIKEFFVK
ncbi:MAG: His/Gly/Thr/Pro-type tRNA ligase C-terminal domain-containing protein, partial [Tenericutes bacterium]|nr:His/Gly/Thr/Pro-type tRNA ligase C-terminal domain-containing protein [Mycoplasmatota bacterium]